MKVPLSLSFASKKDLKIDVDKIQTPISQNEKLEIF